MMSSSTRAAALLLPALLLAACGSDHGDAPAIDVTDLPAGAYAVGTGDAAAPVAGKYYAAADGSRLLVLDDASQQATAIYRRDGNAPWQRTPGVTGETALALSTSQAIAAGPLNPTAVAGSYVVRLAGGAAAAFSIDGKGAIAAGSTPCRLSGTVAVSPLPNVLKLTLATAGCGDLPAQSDGYLVADTDHAPASFRLLTSGASAPLDLWAYPEVPRG